VFFNNIDRVTCSKIVDLELIKINGYLNSKKIYVHFSKSVKKLILDEGYSETYGAREIRRTVERLVSDSLADYLIVNEIESDIIFDTKVKNKKVIYMKSQTLVDFVSENTERKEDNEDKEITCSGCPECK
jgi:ATP-dependent Clp protease ATP-binding subunit ClpA